MGQECCGSSSGCAASSGKGGGGGGGGGFCEEELARVCVPSFLLKPAKIVLGFNNYQVDNFLRRLLFFFSVKKANPVFITASLGNVTFSQSEREVCSSLRYLQHCKTSLLSPLLDRRAQLSLSLQQLGLTDH